MSHNQWNSGKRQARANAKNSPDPLLVGSELSQKLTGVSESTANDIRTSVKRWFSPSKGEVQVTISIDDYRRVHDLLHRRLFLNGGIGSVEDLGDPYAIASMCGNIIECIIQFNREDFGYPVEERRPIMLFINSPGGDVTEGFPLIAAIETSKTPVYTINIGKWDSMAFLIGIAGRKRFALPYTQFLLHEGYNGGINSSGKLLDKLDFDRRFETEVVRNHVLKHSTMSPDFYDASLRNELYMLPEDAKQYGFIDEIVTDLDAIIL